MSYTFICTPEKEWYLKIKNIEELLDYWNIVFNPKMEQALLTINNTKEFGKGNKHCNEYQMMIGLKSKNCHKLYEDVYKDIIYDVRKQQYQALIKDGTIYINKEMGWNSEPKITEQFIHKNTIEFPIMKKEKIKITKFPMGNHFYVYIDGVQIRRGKDLKFNTYETAYDFALKYVK